MPHAYQIKSIQIKSYQFKSIRINSNQINWNQIVSIKKKSNQFKLIQINSSQSKILSIINSIGQNTSMSRYSSNWLVPHGCARFHAGRGCSNMLACSIWVTYHPDCVIVLIVKFLRATQGWERQIENGLWFFYRAQPYLCCGQIWTRQMSCGKSWTGSKIV